MKCVTKIMAMPGTRIIVADLCMIGLAACEGGPGFVNASARTVTCARQVGMLMQSKCTGTHPHVCAGTNDTSEKVEQTGTWVHQVARVMEEQLREDKQELKTREQKKKAKDAKRIRGIVHENKRKNHVQDEVEKLMHHDEQELLSVWEGWHWDDNKGGWLDPELCVETRREEAEYIRRHKMHTTVTRETCLRKTRVPRETCSRETGKAPIKTGWAETIKGQRKAQRASEVGREGK